MIIDIIFLILLAFAIFKGISRGFIVAIFSFLAIIIGVAAAMKLSYIVANWLQHSFNTSAHWLPLLSFIIVLIGVILLVRLVANVIQRGINIAMLGWLNKLGGIVLFVILYIAVYSVFLFYLTKMNIIKPETIAASRTYSFIEPLGSKVIDAIGLIIPVFKNMFQQLSDFFGTMAARHT
ncbi:MAG TPA: CvpA family protein [Parafilimonas sp.]|nr:CvpA family protein [Parafilimonas sp.]